MEKKDHQIVLTGEKNGFIAKSGSLHCEDRYIARDILLKAVYPPKGLIVESMLTADQYIRTVEDNEFRSSSFFIEDVRKKIRDAGKKDLISRITRKLFSNPNFPYPFYFLFPDRDQMIKFIPLSSKYFFDSYYIYHLENEGLLRQRLLTSGRIFVKDIIGLCYAIIPTQEPGGRLSLNILSNFMTEEEFKALAMLALDAPSIRRLSDEENREVFNRKLSCAIPLYNNPGLKLS